MTDFNQQHYKFIPGNRKSTWEMLEFQVEMADHARKTLARCFRNCNVGDAVFWTSQAIYWERCRDIILFGV
jgi:hypothetical protein